MCLRSSPPPSKAPPRVPRRGQVASEHAETPLRRPSHATIVILPDDSHICSISATIERRSEVTVSPKSHLMPLFRLYHVIGGQSNAVPMSSASP
jgi:hypothetical protein